MILLANIALTSFEYREDIIEREYEKIVGFVLPKCRNQVSASFDTHLSLFLMSLFRGPPYLCSKQVSILLRYFQSFFS